MRHGCLSRNVKGTFIGICESHRGITILSLSKRQRETEREREREVSLTINRRLKVGKHNAMSGHTERGREGEREIDFEAIESQLALRRLYTRHKPRTPSHLPLPPPLCTTSPRSLLHHLWPSRPDRGPQTHITPPLSRTALHSSKTFSRWSMGRRYRG